MKAGKIEAQILSLKSEEKIATIGESFDETLTTLNGLLDEVCSGEEALEAGKLREEAFLENCI